MRIINSPPRTNPFVLIYGNSGTGKTHLALTAYELGNTLLVDVDKGSAPAWKNKVFEKVKDSELTVVNYEAFTDLTQLLQLITTNTAEAWSKVLGNKVGPFDYIILDDLTSLQWYIAEEIRRKDDGMKSTAFVQGDAKLSLGRPNFEYKHWGVLLDVFKQLLNKLKEQEKVGIICTALEAWDKDEISGQVSLSPQMQGQIGRMLPAYFDTVVHTDTDVQGNKIATTRAKMKAVAKDRIQPEQDYKTPTMAQIIKGVTR